MTADQPGRARRSAAGVLGALTQSRAIAQGSEGRSSPPATKPKQERWPVVEVFGPTIQGEGPVAGLPTYFVRFGGCDYRCSWCDSPHAVLPEQWSKAPRLTVEAIADEIAGLPDGPGWVTLSGGNPAMYDLSSLVDRLHDDGFNVCVETQGSRWKPWLIDVDSLVLSPKPPSSGEATGQNEKAWAGFLSHCVRNAGRSDVPRTACKVVVFSSEDYEWAAGVFDQVSAEFGWPCYLSVGTVDPNAAYEPFRYREQVGESYKWLCEKVAVDKRMAGVRVLPQLHVIAWGEARGV